MGLFNKLFGQSQQSPSPLTLQEATAGTLIGAMLCVRGTIDAQVDAWGLLKEIPVFDGYDDFQCFRLIESFTRGKRKVDTDFLLRAATVLSLSQRETVVEWIARFIEGAGSPQNAQDYLRLVRSAFAPRGEEEG